MAQPIRVKVSSRYQIAVPSLVRQRLNIQSGDTLLVDIQGSVIVLIPEPRNYTSQLSSLDQEIWQKVDASTYLREERGAWEN